MASRARVSGRVILRYDVNDINPAAYAARLAMGRLHQPAYAARLARFSPHGINGRYMQSAYGTNGPSSRLAKMPR